MVKMVEKNSCFILISSEIPNLMFLTFANQYHSKIAYEFD